MLVEEQAIVGTVKLDAKIACDITKISHGKLSSQLWLEFADGGGVISSNKEVIDVQKGEDKIETGRSEIKIGISSTLLEAEAE
jgi:hypothetical protein